MAEIIDIANAIFRYRGNWSTISNDDKEKFSFIFTRYFSKKYPHHAISLNNKNQDKSIAMDMWFHFMKDKPYPDWFWSKSEKVSKTELDDKDFNLLIKKLQIDKEEDLIYLIDHFPDILDEEIKYYKKKEKDAKK